MKKIIYILLAMLMIFSTTAVGCSNEKERVVIYTCANDKRIVHMQEELAKAFPDYDFIVEYQSTSKLAAKLLAEKKNTDCDIIHDLSYLNLEQLKREDILADVSFIDRSEFVADTNISNNYVIECRTGGGIILNTDVLASRGLAEPTSYQDLLKPEYKGLVSMPDPKSSGTGYMFVKSLVNAWGEERAMAYFEELSENILQFTSSGNGPVNAIKQQEVAIGLGMTQNAVQLIDDGATNIKIKFFEEGSPYSMYGQTIIAGKETKPAVKAVFEWLVKDYLILGAEEFGLEKIYNNRDFVSSNYPNNVVYSNMENDTVEEKERILKLWNIT